MIRKEGYLKKLEEIREIIEKYGDNETIRLKMEETEREIEVFSMMILFVGGFSAGKSALLNKFIDRDLLSENQKPETAVASEVVYSVREYAELFYKSGETGEVTFSEADEADPRSLHFKRYHVNSPILKKYKEYTFVDMPGFNSGIESHNEAILQYAEAGNAYILVIDCEDGEVKASVQDFVEEIRQYEHNLAIAVSKGDKKTSGSLEEIRANIEETANDLFGEVIMVATTSKFEEDTVAKVERMIASFEEQKVFEDRIRPFFYELENYGQALLDTVKSASSMDSTEADKTIREKKKSLDRLKMDKEREAKNLHASYVNTVKPNILTDIEDALLAKAEFLAEQLKAGEDSFSRSVNNTIRPVMVSSLQHHREENFNEFLQGFDFSSTFDNDSMDNFVAEVKAKYNSAKGIIDKIQENIPHEAGKGKGKENANAAYKTAVGVLAAATTVVAPWLEVVLLFLPEIMQVVGFFGKGYEKSKLTSMVRERIIPDLMSKISETIDPDLLELEKQDMAFIEESYKAKIQNEIDAMESAEQMKNEKKTEFELLMKNVEEDQNDLKEIVGNL